MSVRTGIIEAADGQRILNSVISHCLLAHVPLRTKRSQRVEAHFEKEKERKGERKIHPDTRAKKDQSSGLKVIPRIR